MTDLDQYLDTAQLHLLVMRRKVIPESVEAYGIEACSRCDIKQIRILAAPKADVRRYFCGDEAQLFAFGIPDGDAGSLQAALGNIQVSGLVAD